ncbi:Embryogenesis-associated protein EMB8 [Linum perenne]
MNSTLQLQPPPHPNLLLFRRNFPIRPRQFRLYRRGRHKSAATSLLRCTSLLDPFKTFLTHFPSSNSLDLLIPAIGLASGLTLYFTGLNSRADPRGGRFYDIGEWILFNTPTPFNRFVILRCPSISFEGTEMLEGVNDKLVERDMHFVRLNSGRIQVRTSEDNGASMVDKLDYQRVCVSTEDGGVLSLDWPANLNFEEEHGLDTTLLLVPGTPDGSTDHNVKSFVSQALGRGLFPIVMNPRGCAGSPLTTARLFSAADSDDISTVIQLVNKARPWTTLMAVGWGYGANMLTKYLGEVGDRTPLTAATCINNPFDLEEVTRSSPYHVALDQMLTGGLIDILRANKGLFQGKAKGFDMEKALLAKSVRDFEEAISMVSYGFKKLEDFYSKSNTTHLVKDVKVPVLFIQNDDDTVPLFSIPRSSIAENPYTNLLLCSWSPSGAKTNSIEALSWCQNLTMEWLTAVELGLLKGRHPLLTDLDVTINLSKGLTVSESAVVDTDGKNNEPVDVTLAETNGSAVDISDHILEGSSSGQQLNSGSGQYRDNDLQIRGELQEAEIQVVQKTVDTELLEDESENTEDVEKGEVLQSAQVVMNMLDVAMPGVVAEDEKKKVLTAVDQGETLLKALEGAVPEEVREKLTTAASGIMQANRMKLKLDGLSGSSDGKMPNVLGFKSNGDSTSHSTTKVLPLDQRNKTNISTDDVSDDHLGVDNSSGDPEPLSSDNLKKSVELGQPQDMTNQQSDPLASPGVGMNESDHVSDAAMGQSAGDKKSDASVKPVTQGAGSSEEATTNDDESHKSDKSSAQPEMKNEKINDGEKSMDPSSDQSKVTSSNVSEEGISPAGVPGPQPTGKEGNDDQKTDNKSEQPALEQNKPPLSDSSPTFDVVQALDAFTGMDDSTQVAVNSVFGVIENMIEQLEEDKDGKDDVNDGNEVEHKSEDPGSVEQENVDQSLQAGSNSSNCERVVNNFRSQEEKPDQLFVDKSAVSLTNSNASEIPLLVTKNLQEDYLQNAYFSKYLQDKTGDASTKTKDLTHFVKNIILDALKVEVCRKLSVDELRKMKPDLGSDIELVATAVSLAVGNDKDQIWKFNKQNNAVNRTSEIADFVHADKILEAISSAILGTTYLRKVLPVGVIVGSTLAALRRRVNINTEQNNDLESYDQSNRSLENYQGEIRNNKDDEKHRDGLGVPTSNHTSKADGDGVLKNIDNDSVMVGAVTAALGASAFFGLQNENAIVETSAEYMNESGSPKMASDKLDDGMSEKDQNNTVASFAEKAMSVAGPVVPTKGDGEVDQERIVSMLAGLGERGGILRLVGKLALLWGGLRGALSLTDRLISFLDIAERPFYQRILGFTGMALLLWSPVVIPLLPTLVQGWTTGTPSRFAELISILGLYAAILLLVMKWAKKIRGYEHPLKQYGLDFTTLPKIQSFFTGLAGGVGLVLLMQSVNVCLGCASFSWPASHPALENLFSYFKVYGKMILFSLRGTITATAVVLVEELLFRSWLPGEIAVDLGYHRAIVISGLVFALAQRSPLAVPSLWLLSLALSGMRERSQGSLSSVIGLRAGMLASSFILQSGGLLTYKDTLPIWVTGADPLQPFSGVIGLAFSSLMAVVLYPRRQLQEN